MAAETETGFLGCAVGIGIDGEKKFLNLVRGLLVALRNALTWLDVMLHFRLHPHSPRNNLPELLKKRPARLT
jgi:hypothetical protein